MRQSTFARLAAVSLGLGLLALTPTDAAAQSNELEPTALRALSRRFEIDITKETAAPALPTLRQFKLALNPTGATPRLDSVGDPAFGPPANCKMPMLKGDPSLDPKIIERLPDDGVTHAMRAIIVPLCAPPR